MTKKREHNRGTNRLPKNNKAEVAKITESLPDSAAE